jgi:class 3 adenylate cyclase
MDRVISDHGGRIAKYSGDSVLAEFPSAVMLSNARECARGTRAASKETPHEHRLQFRIGVHVGDVMVRDVISLGTA